MTTAELERQISASTFELTGKLVNDAIGRVPSHHWLMRPGPESTHVLWIIGHLATTRRRLVGLFGGTTAYPELNPLFKGGLPLHEDSAYPSSGTVAAMWRDVATPFAETLAAILSHRLDEPSPDGMASLNGKISGGLAATVFHESYHVGELGYLTKWLGHGPLLGR